MHRASSAVFCAFVIAAVPFAPIACSSSADDTPADNDSGVDLETSLDDTPAYDAPIIDGPLGVVILIRPYDPVNRCWFAPPTEVGHPDDLNPDRSYKCKGTTERCYQRTDGIVFYADKDCIHGGNFLFHVDDMLYSDLGPCEPPKHLELSKISDCPTTSCVFARDVLVDLAKGCATAIDSRDCRTGVPTATSCLCDPASSDRVFVAYDGKSTTNAPAGFKPCDSSNPSCAKALSMADSVAPCVIDADAGADASDAAETASDVGADSSTDATDAADGPDAG